MSMSKKIKMADEEILREIKKYLQNNG